MTRAVRACEITVITAKIPAAAKKGIFSGTVLKLNRLSGQKSISSKSTGKGMLVGLDINARTYTDSEAA